MMAIRKAIKRDRDARIRNEHSTEIIPLLEKLSERKREILDLVVAGKPTKVIASKLGTAENTVKNQRPSILAKLNMNCTADLVRIVMEAKIASESFPSDPPDVE